MITLWGRNNSTNVKKVLLTLEELELPYEQILAGREFGINHDADFLAMNPNGLSNAHRGILMGLVRTPPEERDQAAIDASCKECDALFALLDAELAKVKWFSGDEFGVGDIAIAPFIYNLFNVGLTWTPRPNLQRWYQQLTERPAVRKVVMIPVS